MKTYVEANPDVAARLAGRRAAELYNFVYGMKKGDYVACLTRSQRPVRVGRVIGDYQYISVKRIHPHVREVKWENHLHEWETLPPTIQRALKIRRSLFRPSAFEDDVRAALLP
jgi:predicted Mrr-cat superfamily restriction endonuclease